MSLLKTINGFFKDDWTKTVVGGVLAVFLLRLIDWLFINDFFWSRIKDVFNIVLNFFNAVYSVKLYWLILIPIATLLISYSYKRLKTKDMLPESVTINTSPEWLSYTKDVFEEIQYRWDYVFDDFKKNYIITNIRPYCNECSCQLVHNICANCKKQYSDFSSSHGNPKSSHEIEALVIHRIENKLYKN